MHHYLLATLCLGYYDIFKFENNKYINLYHGFMLLFRYFFIYWLVRVCSFYFILFIYFIYSHVRATRNML